MNTVSVKGLDKARVLQVLYNNAKPFGMGVIHYTPEDMTYNKAVELINEYNDFDYLSGRLLKVRFRQDNEIYVSAYDREYGEGKAEELINQLREQEN